jgi:ABC-2 type transport system permease protein
MLPDLTKFRSELDADGSIEPAKRKKLSEFFGSMESFFEHADIVNAETDGDEKHGSFAPMRIRNVELTKSGVAPPKPFEVSFPQSIVWALMGCAAGFAIALVQERTMGTWQRLLIAPLSKVQILAGKALSCFIACVLVLAMMLVVGNLFFEVRITSLFHIVLAVVASAFCFTGLMMVISTFGRTERAVAGAGWASLLPLAMIGGGMVPLFVMPSWMQDLASASPVKWAILSLEGAIWRDFSTTEMLLPLAILVAVGLLGFGLGLTVMMRRSAA